MWLADQIFLSNAVTFPPEGDARFTLAPSTNTGSPAGFSVCDAFTSLYAMPDKTKANLTQLIYGEPFEVHHTEGDMAYGRSLCDGYIGWVSIAALKEGWQAPSHLVSVPVAPLYKSPHLKQTPLMFLPMGAMINATGKSENGYIETASGHWLFEKHVTAEPRENMDHTDIARLFIGQPYVWGGRTGLGIDCSGLVQIALAMKGQRIHRDSDMQFCELGGALGRGDLQAGDIVFFPGHVGIMTDGDNILHANATHMAVTIDPLEDVIGWVARDTDEEPFRGGVRL